MRRRSPSLRRPSLSELLAVKRCRPGGLAPTLLFHPVQDGPRPVGELIYHLTAYPPGQPLSDRNDRTLLVTPGGYIQCRRAGRACEHLELGVMRA